MTCSSIIEVDGSVELEWVMESILSARSGTEKEFKGDQTKYSKRSGGDGSAVKMA